MHRAWTLGLVGSKAYVRGHRAKCERFQPEAWMLDRGDLLGAR